MEDVTRSTYRELTAKDKEQMETVKSIGNTFINILNDFGKGRELSLAITKMEEAVMWAVKHITR